MYRPPFAHQTPAGYEDRDFVYYFDATNTQALNNAAFAAGAILMDVGLPLQSDAPFAWRGVKVQGLGGADPAVAIQFKDCFGNYQSSDFVPIDLYRKPAGISVWGFVPVPQEPDIFMPAGAVIKVNLKNQTSASQDLTKVRITILGTKRFVEQKRAC